MTIINTIFGPLQIARTAFGNKGLTFKKPPSWALTGKPASQAQLNQWIHLALAARAGAGLKGTMVYPSKTGAKRIPVIAAFVGFLRLGLKDKAALVVVKASNGSGNEYDPAKLGLEDAKAAALKAIADVPPPPKKVSKKEQEALKKGLQLSSFMIEYGEQIAAMKAGGTLPKERAENRSWFDESDSGLGDIGTFF
jgi:hypothetical protein